jgi:hypothetical protein
MLGFAFYSFDRAGGFAPSHVKGCRLYLRLVSSYGTTDTVMFDCTRQARLATSQYETGGVRWGIGRRAGDVYRQYVWMTVTTGVQTYTSSAEPAIVGLRKPY